MYVLYNNKYYLMQNAIKQFVPTTELNEAFQFIDKIKAENPDIPALETFDELLSSIKKVIE